MSEETSKNLNKNFSIVLKSAVLIAPYVKHFVFQCEKQDFSYIPGQFITIHFEHAGKTLRRSYSIASIPGETAHCIEFAAGYVKNGPASELLFNLNPGDTLNVTGPFGRLILKEGKENQPKRYIFVSTSTGVTPFRAMLKTLSERFAADAGLRVVLLEGVQYRRDALYSDDFLSFAEKNESFKFYACYSREEDKDLKSHERQGYVQSLFPSLNLNPEEDVVYLCGNPGMIDEAFLSLKEKGFDVKSIFREKYISSK